jgi:tryptophan synthase beta chain
MKKVPDKKGRFGVYGGMFAPETLMAVIEQLQDAYLTIGKSREFRKELAYYFKYYVGRPTALYYASDFSRYIGCKVYLKREDLAFTGAHKINNTIGQVLLAKKMGKTRVNMGLQLPLQQHCLNFSARYIWVK